MKPIKENMPFIEEKVLFLQNHFLHLITFYNTRCCWFRLHPLGAVSLLVSYPSTIKYGSAVWLLRHYPARRAPVGGFAPFLLLCTDSLIYICHYPALRAPLLTEGELYVPSLILPNPADLTACTLSSRCIRAKTPLQSSKNRWHYPCNFCKIPNTHHHFFATFRTPSTTFWLKSAIY